MRLLATSVAAGRRTAQPRRRQRGRRRQECQRRFSSHPQSTHSLRRPLQTVSARSLSLQSHLGATLAIPLPLPQTLPLSLSPTISPLPPSSCTPLPHPPASLVTPPPLDSDALAEVSPRVPSQRPRAPQSRPRVMHLKVDPEGCPTALLPPEERLGQTSVTVYSASRDPSGGVTVFERMLRACVILL